MTFRRNIVANMVGRLWAGSMGFLFVPLYIRWLGMEAFGLVGLSATLMAIFAMLDLGLSTAINREFARRSEEDLPVAQVRARDLLRSFEIVYWLMGAAIATAVILAAPLIAGRWLRVSGLDPSLTITAIRLIGVTIFFRWPVSLYTGALLGLRRQTRLNVVTALYATMQGVGVLVIFTLVRPGIDLFFVWQAAAAALQVALLARLVWLSLGRVERAPRFSLGLLRDVFGFSAGVMTITLLSIALTQLDKLVLTRVLPLREFGYYALAGSIASLLNLAAAAVNSAAFPLLSQLVSVGDERALATTYHRSCQYLAVAIIPAGVALAIFSPEVLGLYIADPIIVERTYRPLAILALGNMVLGLMVLPLSLQLAHGWTRLSLYKNVLAVALFVPAMLVMVRGFGMVGAALTWLLLTLGYFVGEIAVMHRRLLKDEKLRWYVEDTAVPMLTAAIVLLTGKLVFPAHAAASLRIVYLLAVGAVAVAAVAVSLAEVRRPLLAGLGTRLADPNLLK